MTKEDILKEIKNVSEVKGRNIMGLPESFYNPYYLISKCFQEEVLYNMEEEQLNNLLKLAEFSSESFY